MCRNIKLLFNFDPPATDEEIHQASLQFVRKLSGFNKPSAVNQKIFETSVDKISADVKRLMAGLVTSSAPKNREVEAERAKSRSLKRFGKS